MRSEQSMVEGRGRGVLYSGKPRKRQRRDAVLGVLRCTNNTCLHLQPSSKTQRSPALDA